MHDFQNSFFDGLKFLSTSEGFFQIALITIMLSVYSFKYYKKVLMLFFVMVFGLFFWKLSVTENLFVINQDVTSKITAFVFLLISVLNLVQKGDKISKWQSIVRLILVFLFMIVGSRYSFCSGSTMLSTCFAGFFSGFALGLIVVVTLILAAYVSILSVFNLKQRDLILFISGTGFGFALFLIGLII